MSPIRNGSDCELAAHHLDRGDALGRFEVLYAEAAGNRSISRGPI